MQNAMPNLALMIRSWSYVVEMAVPCQAHTLVSCGQTAISPPLFGDNVAGSPRIKEAILRSGHARLPTHRKFPRGLNQFIPLLEWLCDDLDIPSYPQHLLLALFSKQIYRCNEN